MRKHLRQREEGVAAVEFAMVAPVMILLLSGFMEFAWVASARSTLEAATIRAARAIAASDCPGKREGTLKRLIENGMSGYPSADGQKARIQSKSYSGNFADVGEPETFTDENKNGVYDAGEPFIDVNDNGRWDKDMGRIGSIGGAGQVVSYTASYRIRSLIPFFSNMYGIRSVYDLSATTVIRNEPVFRSTGC